MKGPRIEGFVGFLAVEVDPVVRGRFEVYARRQPAEGRLLPRLDRRFPRTQAADALAAMGEGQQVGKLLLQMP
jgi:hypothetical protein